MGTYFNQFYNINSKTTDAVEKVIKKGIFKAKFMKRFNLLKELNKELSEVYGLKELPLRIVHGSKVGKVRKGYITVDGKLSLIRYLRAFRESMIGKLKKYDSLDWAFSILYLVHPKLFSSFVEELERVYQEKEKQNEKDKIEEEIEETEKEIEKKQQNVKKVKREVKNETKKTKQ